MCSKVLRAYRAITLSTGNRKTGQEHLIEAVIESIKTQNHQPPNVESLYKKAGSKRCSHSNRKTLDMTYISLKLSVLQGKSCLIHLSPLTVPEWKHTKETLSWVELPCITENCWLTDQPRGLICPRDSSKEIILTTWHTVQSTGLGTGSPKHWLWFCFSLSMSPWQATSLLWNSHEN